MEGIMAKKIGRREFVKSGAKIGFFAFLGGKSFAQRPEGITFQNEKEIIDIAVAKGSDYFKSTVKAVEAVGGMAKFVPKGSKVAILPNAQRWHPGTFTKPDIVKAVIKMCKDAGAEEVNCLSWLGEKNWEATGLGAAIKEAGGNLKLIEREESLFKPVPVPTGKALKEALIVKELYNNDIFIDMPITKDHAGNKFTGTLKNLMGINFPTNNRLFHKPGWKTDVEAIEHLDQCIADLNTIVKPDLCIVDATEFIITNGPMGPGEVIKPQKVIAGVDRVGMDAYCTTLWGLDAKDIIMINKAYEHGLGEIDIKKLYIKEVKA
jgi:uncharacterized protein (DUF362 family)